MLLLLKLLFYGKKRIRLFAYQTRRAYQLSALKQRLPREKENTGKSYLKLNFKPWKIVFVKELRIRKGQMTNTDKDTLQNTTAATFFVFVSNGKYLKVVLHSGYFKRAPRNRVAVRSYVDLIFWWWYSFPKYCCVSKYVWNIYV